jgi:hypothetical protein
VQTTAMNSQQALISKTALWSDRIVGALAAIVLVLTGMLKLLHPPVLERGFSRLSIPQHQMFSIGLQEFGCTVIYLIPSTGVFGAVLLSGYRGGAIMAALRIGHALVLPIVIGLFLWGGLWLCTPGVRSLLPLLRERR